MVKIQWALDNCGGSSALLEHFKAEASRLVLEDLRGSRVLPSNFVFETCQDSTGVGNSR